MSLVVDIPNALNHLNNEYQLQKDMKGPCIQLYAHDFNY